MHTFITILLILAIMDIAITDGRWVTFPIRYFKAMWTDFRDGFREDMKKAREKNKRLREEAEAYYDEKYK